MLPRRGWSQSVQAFDVDVHPNACAVNFNELLQCELGSDHVIELYEDFCLEDSSHNINFLYDRRLFKADGLHPNKMGCGLLEALIAHQVFKNTTPPPPLQRSCRTRKFSPAPGNGVEEMTLTFSGEVVMRSTMRNRGGATKTKTTKTAGSLHPHTPASLLHPDYYLLTPRAPPPNDPTAFPPLVGNDQQTAQPDEIQQPLLHGYAEALLKPAPVSPPRNSAWDTVSESKHPDIQKRGKSILLLGCNLINTKISC